MKRTYRLYNILFPIWMLIFFPTYLWLLLIPANYLIDYLVTRLSMKYLDIEDYRKKALRHSWKICIIGFLSDLIGAAFLLGTELIVDRQGNRDLYELINGINWNPFVNIYSFLLIVAGIVIAGVCIYFLNRWMLGKDKELTKQQVNKIALYLAIFTAPYLFLIPSMWIYR
ncbi:MAG: hypothetical protein IKR11_09160 [Solobacterium sp.]|nr:hypothetical protein [Solobacterium sp.]